MSVTIKTPEEVVKMRAAGRLAADVLHMIRPHVKPGVSTGELDRICHEYIVNVQQAVPAPLNYRGFPKSICTSVNHQVCHGIPGDKILKEGLIPHDVHGHGSIYDKELVPRANHSYIKRVGSNVRCGSGSTLRSTVGNSLLSSGSTDHLDRTFLDLILYTRICSGSINR